MSYISYMCKPAFIRCWEKRLQIRRGAGKRSLTQVGIYPSSVTRAKGLSFKRNDNQQKGLL